MNDSRKALIESTNKAYPTLGDLAKDDGPAPEPDLPADPAASDPPATPDADASPGDNADDAAQPEPAPAADTPASDEGNDLVEVEGQPYFYHPEHHAKGEETHPNSYKSREDAEIAAQAKLEMMRENAGKLKEQKKGVKSLGLPKAINDPARFDEMTEDAIYDMDNDELRAFVKESDQFIQRSKKKLDSITQQQKQQQQQQQTQQQQQELEQAAVGAIEQLGINPQELAANPELDDPNKVLGYLKSHVITQKIESDLKPIQQELRSLQKDPNKVREMGQAEYAKAVNQKTQELYQKRQELQQTYEQQAGALKAYLDFNAQQQAQAGEPELSTAEKAKIRAAASKEFVEDIKQLNPAFENPDYVRAFEAFARRRKSEFNELLNVDDFVQANEAWEAFKQEQRQKKRNPTPAGARSGSARPQVPAPDPAQQDALRGKPKDKYQMLSNSMEHLKNNTPNY